MSFAGLNRDSVVLLKANGQKITSLMANVQGNRIYMGGRRDLRIEPGDLILRRMSNGSEETYRVADPGFHEGVPGIGPNYQMRVHRLSPEDAASAIASAGDEKISDARRDQLFAHWEDYGLDAIKADLNDGGIRIVGGPPATRSLARAWVRMKEAERLQQAERAANHTFNVSGPNARVNLNSTDNSTNTIISDSSVFNQLHHTIDSSVRDDSERLRLKALIDDMEATKGQQGFAAKYQAFIAQAANHMTILAPMLPALTQFIAS